MLMPKRVKYRKPHSAPRIKGNATRGATVVFGEYGLKALEPKWITARQIEAARITLSRFIKKKGKLWIRVFPDKAITKHPAETRMGKGKGAPVYPLKYFSIALCILCSSFLLPPSITMSSMYRI